MQIKRVAIFASGRGSNAEALFKKALRLPNISIELLLCDQPQAAVLNKAHKYGVQNIVLPFPSKTLNSSLKERRIEYGTQLIQNLTACKIDWILLAGFMRILPRPFLHHFKSPCGLSRVINIHPSLLPKYKGLNGYKQCFEAADPIGGVTVHFVDDSLDGGHVIQQKAFPRLHSDTLDTFTQRGLALEHKMYCALLDDLAHDRHVFSLFK